MTITRYEIEALIPGHVPVHVCFTARKTKGCLINNTKNAYAKLRAFHGVTATLTEAQLDMPWTYKPGVLTFAGGALVVRYSGKTEKDLKA